MSKYVLSSSVDLSPTIPTLKEISFCKKWRLLFWKKWRYRHSKFSLTITQLLVPAILFMLVVLLGIGPRKHIEDDVILSNSTPTEIKFIIHEHEKIRFLMTVQLVLPSCIVLTTLFLPITFIKPIIKEKTRGIWNFLQLKGFHRWMQWLCWFFHEFLILLCNLFTIIFLVKCAFSKDGSVFANTNLSIILLTFFMYFAVTLLCCLFFSCIIKNVKLTWPIWCLYSMLTIILPMLMDKGQLSVELDDFITSNLQLLTSLFPNCALYWAVHVILTYEARGLGMHWRYVTTSEFEYEDSVNLLHILTLWLMDGILFCFFIWYFDNVSPGKFKMAKPFYYLFISKYWSSDKFYSPVKVKVVESITKPSQFSIVLSHIYQRDSKCKEYILNNVNLQFDCGEISVIYGKAKSGKSTLISIIAGFLQPSNGTVSVKTDEPTTSSVLIGERLGFCPQTDIMLYDFLTVKEHLIFHAHLSGKDQTDLQTEVSFILISLDLQTQQTWMGQMLPKDIQRRLGVGMALIGNQGLIIIDEPTLDVDLRLKPRIWKLLRKYRHRSCIIVATKCARETNELAGKLVVIRSGRIKLSANVYDMAEKSIGAGYTLALRINKNAEISPITDLIQRHVSRGRLVEFSGDSLRYRLPLESKELFPDMLFELERKTSEFLIHNIDIFVVSFETALIDFAEPADYITEEKILNELHLEHVNDFRIFQLTQQQMREKCQHALQRLLGLFYKRWCFLYRRWELGLPLIIIPTLIIGLIIYFNLMTPGLIHSYQLLVITILDSRLDLVSTTTMKYVFTNSSHIAYSKRIVAVRSLFYLKAILLSIAIPFCLSIILCSFVIFPVEERVSQLKKLQMLNGVGRFSLWVVTFMFDLTVYCFSAFLVIFVITMDDETGILAKQNRMLITVFVLTGWASIPFTYVLSFMSSNSTTSYLNLLNSKLLTNIIFPMIVLVSASSKIAPINAMGLCFNWLFRLFPNFCCAMSIIKITQIGLDVCRFINTNIIIEMCSTTDLPNEILNCCQNGKLGQMWFTGEIIEDLMSLLGCGFFYILCVWLHEMESKDKSLLILNRLRRWCRCLWKTDSDIDLETIAAYTNRAITVDRVIKRVSGIDVIRNASLTVKCGECVGLLGVSRKSKSTLLSMMAGAESIDQGDITIFETSFETNPKKYLSQVGYCPQHSYLIESFTGREVLILFSMLKGVIDVNLVVDDMISVFHLEEERDMCIKYYDNITKHKLMIALSILTSPPVLLLDEPTTGFDSVSAIQVWKLIKTFVRLDRTVIILPSSLPECRALCSRVAVLTNGRVIHTGKTDQLRADFGDGVTIVIMMNYLIDQEATITLLDQFMDSKFEGCTMVRLYESTICFHLPTFKVQWSYLFAVMEEAKELFELQNYSLSRTTTSEMLSLFTFRP